MALEHCGCAQNAGCDCGKPAEAAPATKRVSTKTKRPRNVNKDVARKRTIGDIVAQLIHAHETGAQVDLRKLKTNASRKHGLGEFPKQVDILAAVPASHREALAPILKAKPVRTASGIAVVAVMSKPHRCPHIATTGNICVYCPGGPDSDFEYSTQSYTGYEPTSMRAIRARYDPYIQVRSRVEQLHEPRTQRGQGRVHSYGRHVHVARQRVQGLFHSKFARRPQRAQLTVRARGRPVLGALAGQVRRAHHREPPRPLLPAASVGHARVWLHAAGNRRAERL